MKKSSRTATSPDTRAPIGRVLNLGTALGRLDSPSELVNGLFFDYFHFRGVRADPLFWNWGELGIKLSRVQLNTIYIYIYIYIYVNIRRLPYYFSGIRPLRRLLLLLIAAFVVVDLPSKRLLLLLIYQEKQQSGPYWA